LLPWHPVLCHTEANRSSGKRSGRLRLGWKHFRRRSCHRTADLTRDHCSSRLKPHSCCNQYRLTLPIHKSMDNRLPKMLIAVCSTTLHTYLGRYNFNYYLENTSNARLVVDRLFLHLLTICNDVVLFFFVTFYRIFAKPRQNISLLPHPMSEQGISVATNGEVESQTMQDCPINPIPGCGAVFR
jgi:hypothetical protein